MFSVLRKIKNRLRPNKNLELSVSKESIDYTYLDFDKTVWDLINEVGPFTRTTPERIYSLVKAIDYIEENNIEGDIVECGVWRGGSMMVAAKQLLSWNNVSRQLYLYDTYEGMTDATDKDVSLLGKKATEYLKESDKYDTMSVWCYASVEDVMQNMKSTNYPDDKIVYVKGKVENTIPDVLPEKIAVLRLDTDWYESTRHELIHLYPKIVKGGILIVDDYGHWQGAKLATDEYLKENNIKVFLSRVDYTCRVAVKVEI